LLKYTPTDCFFGNFSHWETLALAPNEVASGMPTSKTHVLS